VAALGVPERHPVTGGAGWSGGRIDWCAPAGEV